MLDAGLQPERTRLAWRRTVLALTVGGVLALRALPSVLGPWGVGLGIAGTVAGVLVAVAAARRQARVASALRVAEPLSPSGGLLAAVAALVALGALAALAAVLAIVAQRP
jgi:putative membrane protein